MFDQVFSWPSNTACLQSLIDFAESHHLRDRAERSELSFQHLGRLDAEFHALVVAGATSFLLALISLKPLSHKRDRSCPCIEQLLAAWRQAGRR